MATRAGGEGSKKRVHLGEVAQVTESKSKVRKGTDAAIVSENPPLVVQANRGKKAPFYVKKAKEELERFWLDAPGNITLRDEDGEPSWGPVIVCERTTWKDFEKWLDEHEGTIRRWIYEPLDNKGNGRVLIYSIATDAHEEAAGHILASIILQIQKSGNDIDLIRTIRPRSSPRCRIEHNGQVFGQEPDMSITPRGLAVDLGNNIFDNGNGQPFPNFIFEVSYWNESFPSLQRKLRRWMLETTSVQVAIGIKIFEKSREHRAILMLRNVAQPQVVQFGKGAGPINLSFPLALIYSGVELPPALADLDNPMITIDLICLRNDINSVLPLLPAVVA